MIACKTHIALGSSAQDTSKGHGALTDKSLIEETKKVYGWSQDAFFVPTEVKAAWEKIGKRATRRNCPGKIVFQQYLKRSNLNFYGFIRWKCR